MSRYRIAINMEWTSKCNARCAMCPQSAIENPEIMTDAVFDQALKRINPTDVFRTVIAGYGEPTTHPNFMDYVSRVGKHSVRFDMVTNGEMLDEERLRHMDGKIDLLILSFSSIDPDVYSRIHVNLDHKKVMNNIKLAQRLFKKTRFAISLTPLVECIDTLPQTIEWLKNEGIELLTMSPTLYNRAGTMDDHKQATENLREIIKRYHLRSQEMDFIPSTMDILGQLCHNRFRCIPRNTDIFITAGGEYMYCYNDITHRHTVGSIAQTGIREAIEKREKTAPIPEICDNCNMRDRYKAGEFIKVMGKYLLRM